MLSYHLSLRVRSVRGAARDTRRRRRHPRAVTRRVSSPRAPVGRNDQCHHACAQRESTVSLIHVLQCKRRGTTAQSSKLVTARDREHRRFCGPCGSAVGYTSATVRNLSVSRSPLHLSYMARNACARQDPHPPRSMRTSVAFARARVHYAHTLHRIPGVPLTLPLASRQRPASAAASSAARQRPASAAWRPAPPAAS